MKCFRILFLFVFFAIFPLFESFSGTGIGGSFSYFLSTEQTYSAGITLRQDTQPWTFYGNAHLDKKKVSVFADDWIINERIAEHLDYFVLWGASAEFLKDDELLEVSAGSRAGAGIDFFFARRHVEFFLQAVWNPYLGLRRIKEKNEFLFRPVNFPCSSGLRIWF